MTISIEQALATLANHPDYRVLTRFAPVDEFNPVSDSSVNLKRMAVLDTETTGLDKSVAKIIELGYVVVTFDPATAKIHQVVQRYSGFEDPGEPLTKEITEITGITDEDVRGQSFDDIQIQMDLMGVDLIVAHNAPFDRGFMEIRFPYLAEKWWACSQREAPWNAMKTGSVKLEYLVYLLLGRFYGAHRALIDAEVLLSLLAIPEHDGRTVFAHLLNTSRQSTYRVWATGAPFEVKDTLKANGYKWSDGSQEDLPIKAWYKEAVVDLAAEKAWLLDNAYQRNGTITVDQISGWERHTPRYQKRSKQALKDEA